MSQDKIKITSITNKFTIMHKRLANLIDDDINFLDQLNDLLQKIIEAKNSYRTRVLQLINEQWGNGDDEDTN